MNYGDGNIALDTGELKFEFLSEEKVDADKKFTNSVRNLLILVKDFYGADSAAVYWYNKARGTFKYLASSEDDSNDFYVERFEAGNDLLSELCLAKRSDIINIADEMDRKLIRHLKGEFRIRSIIANPLVFDDEVIAIVLCESKTLNFFGTPNLYTLRVFSESITNYIKYYSLNEDFEYEDKLLRLLASNKLGKVDEICEVVRRSFERVVNYEFLVIAIQDESVLEIFKCYWGGHTEIQNDFKGRIEDGSLCLQAVSGNKIIVHSFAREAAEVYRFSLNEKYRSNLNFCCIPVLAGEKCMALIAFETSENVFDLQKKLNEVYKLCYPFFLLLVNMIGGKSSLLDVVDRDSGFYNSRYFDIRLSSDISKNRLFNECTLYCVFTEVDNISSYTERTKIEALFAEELKNSLGGYDMIFRLDDNKYAILMNIASDEKVFLELEKIRKAVSSKIHIIDGKEVSYTVSFAIMKYDDLSLSKQAYVKELDSLLELARSEGGNCVKI